MARFRVVLTTPRGSRQVLARTRRHNGALHERDRAVDSKAAQMRKHGGERRVVRGPTGEPFDTHAVILIDTADIVYRYSVEPDNDWPSKVSRQGVK